MSDTELSPVRSDYGADLSDLESDTPLDNTGDKAGDELDVSGDGGIMKKIVKPGQGWDRPESGADVKVHYVGTLLDGTKFDSSRDREEPFSFKIGQGQVIKGWDQGVAKMKKGEIAVLTCKPEYAYGEAGSPPKIPPNSTLQFEVELLEWTSDKDISKWNKDKVKPALLKKTLVEGESKWEHPKFGAQVKFSAKCIQGNGASFESHEITIGEDAVPKAIERGLKNMAAGEVALVTAKAGSRYVDGDQDVQWEMRLEPWAKTKDLWSMSVQEKLDAANRLKESGNTAFKAGQLKPAARRYKHAIKFLESDYSAKDEEKKLMATALGTIAGNAAAVALAQKDWAWVLTNCDKALGKDPKNYKALMRRGKAQNELNNWDKAADDLDRAQELAQQQEDPVSLKAIQAELGRVAQKKRAYAQKEKKIFGNLFEKLSAIEAKEEPEAPVSKAAPERLPAEAPQEASEAPPMDVDGGAVAA